jgi:hypothetical protein
MPMPMPEVTAGFIHEFMMHDQPAYVVAMRHAASWAPRLWHLIYGCYKTASGPHRNVSVSRVESKVE